MDGANLSVDDRKGLVLGQATGLDGGQGLVCEAVSKLSQAGS